MAKIPKAQESDAQGAQPLPDTGAQVEPAAESSGTENTGDAGSVGSAQDDSVVSPSKLLARVLAHCHLGKPDDVVEVDAEQAPALAGLVDTTPAAVEYALSLKA